jgi:hypothetical protein
MIEIAPALRDGNPALRDGMMEIAPALTPLHLSELLQKQFTMVPVS